MKAKKASKAEMSKEVRRVLNKHRVDLSVMEYSYGGSSIRLSGGLWRVDGSDFTPEAVSYLVSDLGKFGSIYTDLVNWDLNGGGIRIITAEEHKASEQKALNSNPQKSNATGSS